MLSISAVELDLAVNYHFTFANFCKDLIWVTSTNLMGKDLINAIRYGFGTPVS